MKKDGKQREKGGKGEKGSLTPEGKKLGKKQNHYLEETSGKDEDSKRGRCKKVNVKKRYEKLIPKKPRIPAPNLFSRGQLDKGRGHHSGKKKKSGGEKGESVKWEKVAE